jgi:hypothetical protein
MSCKSSIPERRRGCSTWGGARAQSRRHCAFCTNVAAVICDGERCIRPFCDDHRLSAAEHLDLYPWCEKQLCAVARTAKQIESIRVKLRLGEPRLAGTRTPGCCTPAVRQTISCASVLCALDEAGGLMQEVDGFPRSHRVQTALWSARSAAAQFAIYSGCCTRPGIPGSAHRKAPVSWATGLLEGACTIAEAFANRRASRVWALHHKADRRVIPRRSAFARENQADRPDDNGLIKRLRGRVPCSLCVATRAARRRQHVHDYCFSFILSVRRTALLGEYSVKVGGK